MKKLFYAVAALAVVLLLAAAGGRMYLRTAEPDPGRDSRLAGLSAPVAVWRDSLGVPHLWAENEEDLFRAMGYTHAQDRLWQMEFFRRVADGRLAEILGPELVEADRFLRTLGMGRAAVHDERALDDPSRRLMAAYAEGVNAWIRHRGGALPPEFLALRFAPEPWTVRHSLAIGKIMSWDLADWQTGLDLQRSLDRVGAERAEALSPEYPAWGVHILGSDATWEGGRAPLARGSTPRPPAVAGAPLPRIPALAARALDAVSIARASNSWVIGGSRTRSGKPILANDPHLSLRAPSLWYLAALHAGDLQAAGVTIPGIPMVILGHTDRVAWGFTNAMLDDVDFFVEKLHPDDPGQYLAPEGWRRFEVREETIQVRGRTPVVHRVRATRHGPVLSDVEPRAGERVVAMQWTALQPSTSFRALLGMNRARNAEELQRALRDFNDPHQNVVFADAEGTIGYRMVGRVPVRAGGDGLLPAAGWTGEADWVRLLEWEERPHVIDPAEGFIVTANNRQIGPDYPFHLGSHYADPFRAMRIRELIESGAGFTAADVARQQMDVLDLFARRHLPRAVRAARAAGEERAARTLEGWDARATTESRAAALFYLWYEELRRRVGDDEFDGRDVFFPRYALNRILDAGGGEWVDDVRTPRVETLEELSSAAMRDAVRLVGTRSWGDLHSTLIAHALDPARPLERVFDLSVGPFPSPGSPFTVNVAGYGARAPFANTHGPSMRHVVDLADPDGEGGFVVPTGQSGLPFSRHYRDQSARWREGRLWRIPLDRSLAEARAVERMMLTP